MKIKSINIKNYKSFLNSGDIDIEDNIFALIGQNNTGKSTVLDAIQCFFPDYKKNIDDREYHKNTSDSIEISIKFSEVSDEYIEMKLFPDLRKKHNEKIIKLKDNVDDINKEKEKFKDAYQKKIEDLKIKYHIDNNEFFAKLIRPKNGSKKYCLDDNTIISEADLKKILPNLKVIPAIRDPKTESTAGTNSYLKDLIQMLDDSMQTDIIVKDSVISYNDINYIIANESNNRCKDLSEKITSMYSKTIGSDRYTIKIKSDVNISKGTNYSTTLTDKDTMISSDILNCGTGYQSMIILAMLETFVTLSQKNSNYILIIEEPEVYLHPTLQRKMIETLLNISEFNQVLFSTHSPITISKLSQNQIRMVIKEGGQAFVRDISIDTVVEELGIRPDIIFEKNGAIFVEGPDDKVCIEALLYKLNPDFKKYIDVIIAGNCCNLKFYANAQVILRGKTDFPFLICRDADSKGKEKQKEIFKKEILNINKERLIEYEDRINESIVIIGEYSLESLFLDEIYFDSILDIDQEKIQKAIDTYKKVFNYYRNSGISEGEFAKYYQPKLFFEKKLDKYGYENSQAREKWDESYRRKWKDVVIEGIEEGDIDNYLEVRELINRYTEKSMKEKNNYMEEWIKNKSIEELREHGFREVIEVFNVFLEKID